VFLYEGEGKQLLERYGIAVPRGRLASTAEEAIEAQRELGGTAVFKAQVQSGGRGKAGLVRAIAEADGGSAARELLASTHHGEPVRALLVEEQLKPNAEYFVAAYLDAAKHRRVLLISTSGGVDVEAHKADVRSIPFDGASPPGRKTLLDAWEKLGASDSVREELVGFSIAIARCFLEERARLVEVNPVGIVNGRAVAMDAKVTLEDDARPPIVRIRGAGDELEDEAGSLGLPMVRLDGDIGVITSGAGLGLATVDTIAACGARPANFLDLGGGATPERMRTAIGLVSRLKNVRAIFINVHGGLNDCVLLAEGVLASGAASRVPLMVRMSGYRAAEGQALLTGNGIPNAGAEPMTACVESLIAATKERLHEKPASAA
jgi:succinyl-CoA synthetase beta subunit